MSGWFARGARQASGAIAVVTLANHIGFGALAQASGMSMGMAVFTTVAIWALPGQIILVESWALGMALVAIVPPAMLSAARFLPMTVAMLPPMRDARHGEASYYAAAHLISTMSWLGVAPRFPDIAQAGRLAFFFGFALTCWAVAMIGVAAGHAAAGSIPREVQLAMVMMVPLNFLLMLVGETRHRAAALALIAGALLGPVIHLVSPQWSLLGSGLIGGSIAYAYARSTRRHAD